MQTIQPIQNTYKKQLSSLSFDLSLPARFIKWCESQEANRLGWLAIILAVHGCILAPLTVATIVLGGNSMVYWALTIGAMGIALVSNLAAMPTKITIPIFFLSVLIDLVIITICLAKYFMA